ESAAAPPARVGPRPRSSATPEVASAAGPGGTGENEEPRLANSGYAVGRMRRRGRNLLPATPSGVRATPVRPTSPGNEKAGTASEIEAGRNAGQPSAPCF